jgi:hypothetical protein
MTLCHVQWNPKLVWPKQSRNIILLCNLRVEKIGRAVSSQVSLRGKEKSQCLEEHKHSEVLISRQAKMLTTQQMDTHKISCSQMC